MATVRDVVRRALRLTTVTDKQTEPESQDMDDGLVSLNDMIAGWEARGVDVDHVDYTSLNDTFETAKLSSKYRDHVTFCLAKHIASEFALTLPPHAAQSAADGWRVIQANFLESVDLTVDSGLQVMPSQYWGFSRNRSL